jgi:CheY-like chemotaxis protein
MDDHIDGVVATFVDISKRKADEEALRTNANQLQQQAAELLDNDRRKNEFLGLLGHELRNPLAAIVSGLQVLATQTPRAENEAETLALLSSQSRHMARLVDDLLDISRINTGKITLRRQPVKLQEIVTNTLAAMQPQLDAKQHQLTLELPAEPVWVDADPTRLRQIISNVLNNAVKYTAAGGRLRLSVRQTGVAGVSISIGDNGIGIVPEVLPYIFEPFNQIKLSQDPFQDGLGLGLALVHQLVELHGGSVSAYSDGPGRGCEIDILLPLLHETAVPDRTAATATGSASVLPRRILLVDDNVSITTAVAALLQASGHQVRVCNDGPGALAAAAEFRADVALIDIAMPGMDGLEVARRLRADYPDQPVALIAVTGYGREDDVRNFKAAGFDRHLLKPVELAELNAAIAAVCAPVAEQYQSLSAD